MDPFSGLFFSPDRPRRQTRLRRAVAQAIAEREKQDPVGDLALVGRVEGMVHATLADIREIIGEPPPHVPFKEAAE